MKKDTTTTTHLHQCGEESLLRPPAIPKGWRWPMVALSFLFVYLLSAAGGFIRLPGYLSADTSVDSSTAALPTVDDNRTCEANRTAALSSVITPVNTLDFGDLYTFSPGTAFGYKTTLAQNGPRHLVVTGIRLGSSVDTEANGFSSFGQGDDQNGSDDEDGVPELPGSFSQLILRRGEVKSLVVNTLNTTGGDAYLYAFFDWNRDGDFGDAGEFIKDTVANNETSVTLNIVVPGNAGNSFAGMRLRITTDDLGTGDAASLGYASNGEVEDYYMEIVETPLANNDEAAIVSADGGSVNPLANDYPQPPAPSATTTFLTPMPAGFTVTAGNQINVAPGTAPGTYQITKIVQW